MLKSGCIQPLFKFLEDNKMFLQPDIILNRITDITPQMLTSKNINALLIDVDNTLSTHKGQKFVDGIQGWIETMHQNNVKLVILSNAKTKRLTVFANRIGIYGIGMAAKPLPFGYLKAARKVQEKLKNIAIVGDQLFTDILGGKLAGTKTILVTPILPEDGLSFKIRRKLENKIKSKFKMTEEKYVG